MTTHQQPGTVETGDRAPIQVHARQEQDGWNEQLLANGLRLPRREPYRSRSSGGTGSRAAAACAPRAG